MTDIISVDDLELLPVSVRGLLSNALQHTLFPASSLLQKMTYFIPEFILRCINYKKYGML